MTEEEWLAAIDATPMLEFLRGKVSDRKLRLFAVACCRHIWTLIPDERSRQAIQTSELFADSQATTHEWQVAADAAVAATFEAYSANAASPNEANMIVQAAAACALSAIMASTSIDFVAAPATPRDSLAAATGTVYCALQIAQGAMRHTEMLWLATALRCIFNPFHPITLSPSWLTSTVTALAQQMYESRDFSAMPILADALGDAGCANEDILSHCRGPGPHTRGCWVIDLLLQKA